MVVGSGVGNKAGSVANRTNASSTIQAKPTASLPLNASSDQRLLLACCGMSVLTAYSSTFASGRTIR